MFDSHCHLHDARIGAAAPSLIARARAAGVSRMLLAGVSPDGWRDEDRLARAHPELALSYGVHPQVIAACSDEEAAQMVAALDGALTGGLRRPVAVGEIGLDGMGERRASLERQDRAFRAQLAVARAHDLPVILHLLDAQARALAILKKDRPPRAGGVVHSFSGSSEMAREFLALGLHLSFAGPVTYPNARKTREAARVVPGERLLVETDAPDQTPPAFRPARNEPSFLVAIVDALAALRGEDRDALAALTDDNARRLFGVS